MGLRQKIWARKKRIELMTILGYCCATCESKENLVFDCKEPRGDYHHRMDTSHRMSFYRKEFKEGNLQILCESCNNKKSIKDREFYPF